MIPAESDWASHVPVLKALLEKYPIRRAVEHGCGIYSTPILAQCTGFSVDGDEEWIRKAKEATKFNGAWRYVLGSTLKPFDIRGADLAFIDGITEYRRESAQHALDARVPFVVIHDAERPGTYKWGQLETRGYHRRDFTANHGLHKMTTVFSVRPISISPEDHT